MFAPLVGGAEVRAEKQAHQLQTLGQEVMVVTLPTIKHGNNRKRLMVCRLYVLVEASIDAMAGCISVD